MSTNDKDENNRQPLIKIPYFLILGILEYVNLINFRNSKFYIK